MAAKRTTGGENQADVEECELSICPQCGCPPRTSDYSSIGLRGWAPDSFRCPKCGYFGQPAVRTSHIEFADEEKAALHQAIQSESSKSLVPHTPSTLHLLLVYVFFTNFATLLGAMTVMLPGHLNLFFTPIFFFGAILICIRHYLWVKQPARKPGMTEVRP